MQEIYNVIKKHIFYLSEKAKPVVKRGRKATGLEKDGRAAWLNQTFLIDTFSR
jgi:hypothetical protein